MLCFHFCVEFDVKGADRLSSIDCFVGHILFFPEKSNCVTVRIPTRGLSGVSVFSVFARQLCKVG